MKKTNKDSSMIAELYRMYEQRMFFEARGILSDDQLAKEHQQRNQLLDDETYREQYRFKQFLGIHQNAVYQTDDQCCRDNYGQYG